MHVVNRLVLSTALLSFLLSAPSHGQEEGIKVHGHWEIEVLDKNGNVLQKRAFQNALTESGQRALAAILSGGSVVSERLSGNGPAWTIVAIGTVADGVIGTDPDCNKIIGPTFSSANFEDQSATLDPVGGLSRSFTLRRVISVPAGCISGNDFSISEVATGLGYSTIGSASTLTVGFSRKVLDAPVTGILPGQPIALSVTFSFE